MKITVFALSVIAVSVPAWAKLPPPSDEAKAKAAETAAKAAHSGKVEAYLLCKSQDKVAAHYLKTNKSAGKDKDTKPAAACVDPGSYVAAADKDKKKP